MADVFNDILLGSQLGRIILFAMYNLLELPPIGCRPLVGGIADGDNRVYFQLMGYFEKGLELSFQAPVNTDPLRRQPTGSGR